MKEFLEYISKNEILSKGLKYIIYNNKSNFNPYHDFNHNLFISFHCYKMGNEYLLNKTEIDNLILSGLFHDFNHSGGKLKDDANIVLSKNGYNDFCIQNNMTIDNNIYELIDSTEYPLKNIILNKSKEIIRDADMLYTFNLSYFQNIILGLASEFNIDIKTRLEQQIIFINNLKFYTEYANNIFNLNKDNLLHELKLYNNILTF